MAESPNAGAWRRIAGRVAATVVFSGIVTVALLFVSRSTAYAKADLKSLDLGIPLAWATQDQTYFDPPTFPHEVFFASPWEHPMTVNTPALLANMLLVSAVLWLFLLGWRRLSRGHPASTVSRREWR